MKALSVLVVEDSPPMADAISKMLQQFGFGEIHIAYDGEEGFSAFQKHKPDLVITDWHMDPIDGMEMTRWIRRNKHSYKRSIPVILMTGYTEKSRIAQARDHGVTEILLKPFKAQDLARRIMHVIDVPRDFVEINDFFGPDRRRKEREYNNEDRRHTKPQEIV